MRRGEDYIGRYKDRMNRLWYNPRIMGAKPPTLRERIRWMVRWWRGERTGGAKE